MSAPWTDVVRDLPLADDKVVEFVDCHRNTIAYGSRRSLDALNASLAASTAEEESVFGAKPMASNGTVSRCLHTAVSGHARVEHFGVWHRSRTGCESEGPGRGETADEVRRHLRQGVRNAHPVRLPVPVDAHLVTTPRGLRLTVNDDSTQLYRVEIPLFHERVDFLKLYYLVGAGGVHQLALLQDDLSVRDVHVTAPDAPLRKGNKARRLLTA